MFLGAYVSKPKGTQKTIILFSKIFFGESVDIVTLRWLYVNKRKTKNEIENRFFSIRNRKDSRHFIYIYELSLISGQNSFTNVMNSCWKYVTLSSFIKSCSNNK